MILLSSSFFTIFLSWILSSIILFSFSCFIFNNWYFNKEFSVLKLSIITFVLIFSILYFSSFSFFSSMSKFILLCSSSLSKISTFLSLFLPKNLSILFLQSLFSFLISFILVSIISFASSNFLFVDFIIESTFCDKLSFSSFLKLISELRLLIFSFKRTIWLLYLSQFNFNCKFSLNILFFSLFILSISSFNPLFFSLIIFISFCNSIIFLFNVSFSFFKFSFSSDNSLSSFINTLLFLYKGEPKDFLFCKIKLSLNCSDFILSRIFCLKILFFSASLFCTYIL